MSRSRLFESQAPSHPDPIRIAAISAAISVNIALLALLVRPPEFTFPTVHPDDSLITIVIPDKKPPIKLPDPPPLKQVVKQPVPHQDLPIPRHQIPVVTDKSTPMSTDFVQQPPTDTKVEPTTIAPPQLVQQALNPIASPAPTYPRIALSDGITGTVELELLVGVDGRVLKVDVVHSSGNRELDRAASDEVLRNWRFQPAMRDGVAVQALGRVPIVFSLDGR